MTSAINICLNLRNTGFTCRKGVLYMLNASNIGNKYILKAFPYLSHHCRYYATQKEVYKRDKPHCNIGTIGHVDHGKTTLTSAITKVLSQKSLAVMKKFEEIDNAPEEKLRGITIRYSNIEYSTEKRHYGHIDCPGHADYIKNMIIGTCQMDGAILVVAGTDGVMPQTKEHFMLAKQIGIKDFVIFINKVDAADKDMIELVEMEIRDLATELGFDGEKIPVVCGSALAALEGKDDDTIGANSVQKLLDTVDKYISTPLRELEKPFVMPIETVYSIKGRGTVVSGRLEKGRIVKGQEVEIVGHGKKEKSTVTGLEMFNKILDEAQAGDKCGLLLRGLKKDGVQRGMFLAQPNTVNLADNVEAQIYIMNKEECGRTKPVLPYMKFEVYSKCWECTASILIPGKDMVMPGEDGTFIVRLLKPMAVVEGQRFTVRQLGNPVGTGVVSQIKPNMTYAELQDISISRLKREQQKTKKVKKKRK